MKNLLILLLTMTLFACTKVKTPEQTKVCKDTIVKVDTIQKADTLAKVKSVR